MNHIIYFEIQVNDLARARKFYTAAFGWEFALQEGLPIEYWQIKTESINGGMLERPAAIATEHGTNAFTCSMEVKSFDETAKKILEAGGIVAMDKFALPGKCWQGYFVDTEHNVFGVIELDPEAK